MVSLPTGVPNASGVGWNLQITHYISETVWVSLNPLNHTILFVGLHSATLLPISWWVKSELQIWQTGSRQVINRAKRGRGMSHMTHCKFFGPNLISGRTEGSVYSFRFVLMWVIYHTSLLRLREGYECVFWNLKNVKTYSRTLANYSWRGQVQSAVDADCHLVDHTHI